MSGARPGGDEPVLGLSQIPDAKGEYCDGDASFNKDDSFAAEIAEGGMQAEPFRFSLLDDLAVLDVAMFQDPWSAKHGKGTQCWQNVITLLNLDLAKRKEQRRCMNTQTVMLRLGALVENKKKALDYARLRCKDHEQYNKLTLLVRGCKELMKSGASKRKKKRHHEQHMEEELKNDMHEVLVCAGGGNDLDESTAGVCQGECHSTIASSAPVGYEGTPSPGTPGCSWRRQAEQHCNTKESSAWYCILCQMRHRPP